MPSPAGPVDLWWHVGPDAAGRGRGRALLRHAVAARCHREPGTPALAPDARGRPSLLPGQGLPPLRLTAAHCGPVTVAAVVSPGAGGRTPAAGGGVGSAQGAVLGTDVDTDPGTALGIDIEFLPRPPSPALLLQALGDTERADLEARPAPDRCAAFLAVWTAKEAVAKALGWPLLRALVDVEIALRPRPVVARLGRDLAPRGWHLVPLRLPGLPHTVTLALRHPHTDPERETSWTSPAGPPSSPGGPVASDWPSRGPSTTTAPGSSSPGATRNTAVRPSPGSTAATT
ncbi:4'-phosphopantetheinyl transferase family protein [Streptomyces hydrogenans]|uniref:4'-phosphopantetheinyl transferase family protein n=1 Tax=Streptomyces hydrogenans TaxID=1873719 RepID=UPI0036EB324F